ncbi:MAG: hypothetical protein HYY67_09045 [Thaumarchaeota archaeon]|nr:hypothetical protein [Nitrososphaerota archaeon]
MASRDPRRINIRPLKELATKILPKDSVLREIILGDKDELGAEEYIAKVDIWLRLLGREFPR